MERLLCIISSMDTGGAETFLMKLYRKLDKNKYQMDFCVSDDEKGFYDDEILGMGGKILHTVKKSKNPFASILNTYRIIKNGKYRRVIRIAQHSLAVIDLIVARFAGAKVLVLRSSNSNTNHGGFEAVLHKLFIFLPKIVPNVKIAPSKKAAEFVFGKKASENEVIYLNNGIPIESFAYNAEARKKIRLEFQIEDAYVLGHIGRFARQKNHKRIIDIFKKTQEKRNDARLILVGQGATEEEIKEYVSKLGLSEYVFFAGVRQDIPDLLSAMDVFLFPSLYEGMPNTIIEAQANGLPCVMSDTITEEAMIADNVRAISLDEDDSFWADQVLRSKREESFVNAEKLREAGYDINNVIEVFTKNVFGA